MTNLEVLIEGIKEIAQNHNFGCDTNWEEEGEVCIFGGCNVPTLSDVMMLCEDVNIDSSCIESSEFGIDVFLDDEWLAYTANEEYVMGTEMWKRHTMSL